MSSMSCNTFYCENSLCMKQSGVKNELEKVEGEKKCDIMRYNWADSYKCSSCNAIFYHCNQCADNTRIQKLILRSRLNRHHHQHHSIEMEAESRKSKKLKTTRCHPIVSQIHEQDMRTEVQQIKGKDMISSANDNSQNNIY